MIAWVILWINCALLLIFPEDVFGGCGKSKGKSKEKEDDTCWYHLWYFWVIVALFFTGGSVILFFYCKVRAKNTRHQNAGRRRNPQMFLPPPPPSYETPGHQPPPYNIAVSVSVEFRGFPAHSGTTHQNVGRQSLDRSDDLMEIDEDEDNIQVHSYRSESVPPPYTPVDDENNNITSQNSQNQRCHGGSRNFTTRAPLILQASELNQVHSSNHNNNNNNFLQHNNSSYIIPSSQQPPAYDYEDPAGEFSIENSITTPQTWQTSSISSGTNGSHAPVTTTLSMSSSLPPSSTTPIYTRSALLSNNETTPQNQTINTSTRRSDSHVHHCESSSYSNPNQSVLNDVDVPHRNVSSEYTYPTRQLEAAATATTTTTAHDRLQRVASWGSTSHSNSNTPAATNYTNINSASASRTSMSTLDGMSVSALRQPEGNQGFQRRGSDNTVYNANKRHSLGAIRYANNLARKNSQDQTGATGASSGGEGHSRHGSVPTRGRLAQRGRGVNQHGKRT